MIYTLLIDSLEILIDTNDQTVRFIEEWNSIENLMSDYPNNANAYFVKMIAELLFDSKLDLATILSIRSGATLYN